jgi:Fis family transcriptional regulator
MRPKIQSLSAVIENYFDHFFNEYSSPTNLHECVLAEVEKTLIRVTLQSVQGNKTKAAEILGINRNTLKKKIDHYQLGA